MERATNTFEDFVNGVVEAMTESRNAKWVWNVIRGDKPEAAGEYQILGFVDDEPVHKISLDITRYSMGDARRGYDLTTDHMRLLTTGRGRLRLLTEIIPQLVPFDDSLRKTIWEVLQEDDWL